MSTLKTPRNLFEKKIPELKKKSGKYFIIDLESISYFEFSVCV